MLAARGDKAKAMTKRPSKEAGAAAMPVASRWVSMTRTPFLAEWLGQDAARRGQIARARQPRLGRELGVRDSHGHEAERPSNRSRHKRHRFALVAPDSKAGGFAVSDDEVGSCPRSGISGDEISGGQCTAPLSTR